MDALVVVGHRYRPSRAEVVSSEVGIQVSRGVIRQCDETEYQKVEGTN